MEVVDTARPSKWYELRSPEMCCNIVEMILRIKLNSYINKANLCQSIRNLPAESLWIMLH